MVNLTPEDLLTNGFLKKIDEGGSLSDQAFCAVINFVGSAL